MDNVVILPVVTKLDTTAERVLTGALNHDLKSAIVIGYDKDGNEYFASSIADGGNVLWLIERMKMALLKVGNE